MIGATRVMRLAGVAETALEQGRSIDIVEPILVGKAASHARRQASASPEHQHRRA